MEQRTPAWLRKPEHKEPVVLTEKGWEVKSTGELLVSVKNLNDRFSDYFGITLADAQSMAEPVVAEKLPETASVEEEIKLESSSGSEEVKEEQKTEEPAPVEVKERRKPGPKPKVKPQ